MTRPAPARTDAPTEFDRALTFLESRQQPSGEFVALAGRLHNLRDGEQHRSIFGTALVARVLMRLADDHRALNILKRARDFLRGQREPTGLWRYFGRGSHIPPDADDTAYSLLVLPPHPDDHIAIDAILQNRNGSGAVLTWLLDGYGRDFDNDVDAVVNAHVYTLLCARSISDPPLRAFLEKVLIDGSFAGGTPYYPSPLFFLNAMAGLKGVLSSEAAQRLETEINKRLPRDADGAIVDAALASAALAASHGGESARGELVERILVDQREDGGWDAEGIFGGLHQGSWCWYGSRELTTTLCIQAIAPEFP